MTTGNYGRYYYLAHAHSYCGQDINILDSLLGMQPTRVSCAAFMTYHVYPVSCIQLYADPMCAILLEPIYHNMVD